MPKRSSIKWRDKDLAEMQRIAKNFNAKISRVAKSKPHIAEFLPERITVKDLKSKISTRQDFNRELNSLKRFSQKGAEKVKTLPGGKTLTNYAHKEAHIKARVYNAKQARKRKEANVSVQKGTMGQISKQNLRPRVLSDTKSPKEWDKLVEVFEKGIRSSYDRERAESYKENYLKAIENLGAYGEELAEHIRGLDAEFIVEQSIQNPILSIDFPYDPLEAYSIAESVLDEWKSIR